jgi:phosphoglycerate kinase
MINYLENQDISGKKVVARFDFNVPLKNGKITDTTRIDLSLETIKTLLDKGASKITMMSHLGRPKGKFDKNLSLEPIAKYIADQLSIDVVLTESATDRGIKTLLSLPTTKLVLLENLRFHPEETSNDSEFSRKLASYGDVYVNDAFGTSHRKHSSVHGIVAHFEHKNVFAGLLIEKELSALNKVLEAPKKPFVGVIGGAKVSDKIKIIEQLLGPVDQLIIGGAMAYPFLSAKGYSVGKSLCSDEDVILAKKILSSKNKAKIVLPLDHTVASSLNGEPSFTTGEDISEEMMGLDIGEKTIASYSQICSKAKTILWNGLMGLFENENFSKGTFAIAKSLSNNTDCFSLVGGGDSVSAVNKSGLANTMGHISTGGGASLEYIEQGSLVGVQALKHGLK